jgi:NitT/TauT family transport system permease protein
MIVQTAIRDMNSLSSNLLVTLGEAIAGFCLGNTMGFAVAVLFAHSRVAEKAIYPYAIALKTTPVIALAPLLVVWFGTGQVSKIVASAVICFFPIIVNATRGLRAADSEALDLFRSLTASNVQIFFKLRLPTALPYIFSALRISSSLSVVGAIVGEFVGAQHGLGYLILVSSYHLETDVMFAAVIAAALGGIAFFGAVSVLEKMLVPWATEQEE